LFWLWKNFSFLKEEQNGQDVMVKAAIGGISVVLDLESGPVRGRSLFVPSVVLTINYCGFN